MNEIGAVGMENMIGRGYKFNLYVDGIERLYNQFFVYFEC